MRVHRDLAGASAERGSVVAAGNFDGVHLGHQEVFRRAAARARSLGVSSLLLTFEAHPARFLSPGQAPLPLMELPDRLLLAARHGIDAALVLPFTPELAREPAEGFVRRLLAGVLGARGVAVGEGWRFGRGRAGDTRLLARLGDELGFTLEAVPSVAVKGSPVSSTRIREALAAGRVDEAALLLGRPHFLRGTVEHGHGRGRLLGFPTVNLHGEVLVPPAGVYGGACSPSDGGWLLPAAVFVGTRPTFGGGPKTVEAHLPGVERDLYGARLVLGFLSRIRGEAAFPDAASLSARIALDLPLARRAFEAAGLASLP